MTLAGRLLHLLDAAETGRAIAGCDRDYADERALVLDAVELLEVHDELLNQVEQQFDEAINLLIAATEALSSGQDRTDVAVEIDAWLAVNNPTKSEVAL